MFELENSFLENTARLISAENMKVKSFKDSRVRISVLDRINIAHEKFKISLNDIKLSYVPKDTNGSFIWVKDEDGKELKDQFFPEKMLSAEELEKFYKDLNELINEKCIILDDTEKDNRLFAAMGKILEDPKELELATSGDEYLYNLLCERFGVEV